MCSNHGRRSRAAFAALCFSAWLLAAGTSWAEEHSPGISLPPNQQLPNSASTPQTLPEIAKTHALRSRSLAIGLTALASESLEFTSDLAGDTKQASDDLNQAGQLVIDSKDTQSLLDTAQTMQSLSIASSEIAESSATEAILAQGQALARMTRSRDRWKTAALVFAGLALSGWGAFAFF